MIGEAIDQLFPDPTAAPLFMVESYWPGVSTARVAAADAQTVHALEQLGEGGSTSQHLGSLLVPDDELLLRVFVGGTVELVTSANELAGIPVERVVAILALPSTR
jgi:hypothetical protein